MMHWKNTYIVVVAMWAILVTFFIICHIFAERFLALFAHKDHLSCLPQSVILLLCMAPIHMAVNLRMDEWSMLILSIHSRKSDQQFKH